MYRVVVLGCVAGVLSVGGAIALVMVQNGAFTHTPSPSLAHSPDVSIAPQELQKDTEVTRISRPVVGPQDVARMHAPVQTQVAPRREADTRPRLDLTASTENSAALADVPLSPFSNLADLAKPGEPAPRRPLTVRERAQDIGAAPLVTETWQIGVFR